MVLPGTAAIIYIQQQGGLADGFAIADLKYQLPGGGTCQNLIDCPNATYPMLLFQMLPNGILGLVLAGLLAAMMSSVSATFNSASTLITMDFAQKLYPRLTSQQLVRIGQVSTLVLVILACLWAPQIERFSSLWEYLQIVLSFIAPPVAAAFILGLFYKGASATGAFTSLLVGAVISIIFLVLDAQEVENWFTTMHFLHRTFYLFLVCGLVNYAVSQFTTPPTAEQVANYTWDRSVIAADSETLIGLPWYKNYRYQSIILLVITALLVGWFW